MHFAGDVQGVGFRFTACRAAGGHDVTGYVKNLRDGRVECVVEGDSKDNDAFLAELSERMARYITQQTQQHAPYAGDFGDFGVRF